MVQLVAASKFLEAADKCDSHNEVLYALVRIPPLATNPRIHHTLWGVNCDWEILEAFADKSSQEIIEHPAVYRFIMEHVTDAWAPLTVLSILSRNPRFAEMKEIIDTVLSSKENMVREICEAECLSRTIEPLKKHPDLLFDRRVVDAFIEAIRSGLAIELLLAVPELSEHERIKPVITRNLPDYLNRNVRY